MMRSSLVKLIIYLVALLLPFGITPAAWAGAAEEVAAIGQQRGAAFEKGDIDAYMVAFADNAVFTPATQPFRLEGKAAIKEFFTTFFQTYPTRHGVGRQNSTRLYANDTVVVSNTHQDPRNAPSHRSFLDARGRTDLDPLIVAEEAAHSASKAEPQPPRYIIWRRLSAFIGRLNSGRQAPIRTL